jgi:hypothetical protein
MDVTVTVTRDDEAQVARINRCVILYESLMSVLFTYGQRTRVEGSPSLVIVE